MSKKHRKQWSFSLTEELEFKINEYKKIYHLKENKDVLTHLFDNSLNLKPNILKVIDNICNEFKTTKNDILNPIIDKHINKLKREGVIKEKNKHSVKSESELLIVLNSIVDEYNKSPKEERKFISPTLVYKYLLINKNKYKQKNFTVIKRVLGGYTDLDISFISKYHKENDLTINNNYRYKQS